MQKAFSVTKKGFNEQVEIGEVFESGGEKYVLTHITKISIGYDRQSVDASIVGQKVGSNSNYGLYYPKKQTKRYEKMTGRVVSAGDLLENRDRDLVALVIGITDMYYDFVDLVVEYEVELLKPWNNEEIERAVKRDKRTKFKVIG